jgi:copper homeostasis protein (lipoprotein)
MKVKYLIPALLIAAVFGCKHEAKKATPAVYKGLYSFGPEVKSFKDCETGSEFWAIDSSATRS